MVIKNILIPLFIISFISFAGCSDAPTSVGSNLLRQDNIGVLNFSSLTDSSYQTSSYIKRVAPLGSSTRLFLGRYSNIDTAAILIRFYFPLADSTKNDIRNNNLTVTSASVRFTRDYVAGDSTSAFGLQAFKVNNEWFANFDADSLQTLNIDPTDVSSQFNLTDSLCSFNLNNQLVSSWLLTAADSSFDNGVIILPTPNVTNQVIGFTALSAYATLPVPQLVVVIDKPGVYSNDTLIFTPLTDLSIVTGSKPAVNSELFYLEGSVTLNGKLTFDISKVPAHSIINNATLTLTYDSLSSTGPLPSTIYAFNMKDSSTNVVDSTVIGSLFKGNGIYTGDITRFVGSWVKGQNEGLLLVPINPYSTVSLLALKSSTAADMSVRPKLEIVYTIKK